MFVYSYSVKIHESIQQAIGKHFLPPACCESVEVFKEVVVGWQEFRWTWQMRQNFVAQFVHLLKCWLYGVWWDIIMENWALSVDQSWLQVLQFSVHLIDVLSILLRCNDFTGIQKAVVDQTSSRPPNSDHEFFFFFGASLALGSALKLLFGPISPFQFASNTEWPFNGWLWVLQQILM